MKFTATCELGESLKFTYQKFGPDLRMSIFIYVYNMSIIEVLAGQESVCIK